MIIPLKVYLDSELWELARFLLKEIEASQERLIDVSEELMRRFENDRDSEDM